MPMPTAKSAVTLALFTAVAAAAAGCGNPVSKSNYDKIQNDMTQDQVEGILGKGEEKASSSMSVPGLSAGNVSLPGVSAKAITWKDGSKTITVSFINGKVQGKAEDGL